MLISYVSTLFLIRLKFHNMVATVLCIDKIHMDSADLQTSTYCKGGRSTAEKSKSSKVSPSNCGCVINIMIVDTLVLMFDLLKNWSKKHLLSFCHSVSTLVFVIWKLVCVSVLKTLGVGMGPSQELALTRHWLGNFWKARTRFHQKSQDSGSIGLKVVTLSRLGNFFVEG